MRSTCWTQKTVMNRRQMYPNVQLYSCCDRRRTAVLAMSDILVKRWAPAENLPARKSLHPTPSPSADSLYHVLQFSHFKVKLRLRVVFPRPHGSCSHKTQQTYPIFAFPTSTPTFRIGNTQYFSEYRPYINYQLPDVENTSSVMSNYRVRECE